MIRIKMTHYNTGLLFVKSIDPLGQICISLLGQTYSMYGFYYTTAVSGKHQTNLLLYDACHGQVSWISDNLTLSKLARHPLVTEISLCEVSSSKRDLFRNVLTSLPIMEKPTLHDLIHKAQSFPVHNYMIEKLSPDNFHKTHILEMDPDRETNNLSEVRDRVGQLQRGTLVKLIASLLDEMMKDHTLMDRILARGERVTHSILESCLNDSSELIASVQRGFSSGKIDWDQLEAILDQINIHRYQIGLLSGVPCDLLSLKKPEKSMKPNNKKHELVNAEVQKYLKTLFYDLSKGKQGTLDISILLSLLDSRSEVDTNLKTLTVQIPLYFTLKSGKRVSSDRDIPSLSLDELHEMVDLLEERENDEITRWKILLTRELTVRTSRKKS